MNMMGLDPGVGLGGRRGRGRGDLQGGSSCGFVVMRTGSESLIVIGLSPSPARRPSRSREVRWVCQARDGGNSS